MALAAMALAGLACAGKLACAGELACAGLEKGLQREKIID